MTMSKKLYAIGILFAVSAVGLGFFTVAAQGNGISDQQIELIRSNCLSTKNTLNQLHASDALLRVNRGQIYESMSTKLMERFNGRVVGNGYNNSSLTAVATGYGQALDTFRSDYKTYEEQLASTISIDCSNRPSEFYDAVTSARTKRNQVHADVIKLNQYVDQYQSAVDQFEKDYQVALQGVQQ